MSQVQDVENIFRKNRLGNSGKEKAVKLRDLIPLLQAMNKVEEVKKVLA